MVLGKTIQLTIQIFENKILQNIVEKTLKIERVKEKIKIFAQKYEAKIILCK